MNEDGGRLTQIALDYGRLAIGVLAAVTTGSSAALTLALAVVVAAPSRLPGLPYGDLPAALLAIGGAASLACLASGSAYFAQVALSMNTAAAGRALHVVTVALMTAAYLAFAVGGVAFSHFCLAATRLLAHVSPTAA